MLGELIMSCAVSHGMTNEETTSSTATKSLTDSVLEVNGGVTEEI